jgi:hypothetical protein|tara:strand:- start:512 stop:1003 length:492 start_codon:yes stop_codon:yes gene_type:complete
VSELTLHTSKAKSLLLLLASLLFTVAGVFMAQDGELMIHVSYLFFGLCSVVFVVQLITGGGYLKLRDDEFEFGFGFGRKQRIKWDDVDSFGIAVVRNLSGRYVPPTRLVGWNYKQGVDVSKFGRVMSKTLSGREACLPYTYGIKMEELLSLLSEHLERSRDRR